MREIKFEFIYSDGYGKFLKAIANFEELCDNNTPNDYMYEKALESYEDYQGIENFDLIAKRQFIGSTDKNDVEIYEGDIVTRWNIDNRNTKRKAEVIFSQGSIVAVENKGFPTEKKWNLWSMCKSFEVIGNIHENKDLLK